MRCVLLLCGLFASCIVVVKSDFRITPRIIGGEKAQIEQFNWQVVLLYELKLLCGGTIISPTKVVSAGHCVHRITDTGPLQVRVGSVDWNKGGKLVNVARFVKHPNYNKPTSLNNDVAVIMLSESLTFSPTIGAVVLAGRSLNLPAGTMVNISGYGSTSPGSNDAVVLRYVAVPIVSPVQCKKAYKKYPGIAKLTDNMICAGFYGVGGKDSCRGDSGGPLVYNSNASAPILYGIISWGNDCADPEFPGVYAKVSVYRDWINNTT